LFMNQLRRESSVAHLNPDTEEASVQDAVGASTLEKYEARIRRDVANDIKALLSRTKAYVQHSTTRPTSNPEHTKGLSAPKDVRMHPETSLARRLEDPVLWAKLRAFQLEEEREAKEAAAVKEAQRIKEKKEQLQAYKELRNQVSLQLMEERNAAAKAEAAYAAQVSKYLKQKAAMDLQRQREKRASEKKKVEELHDRFSVSNHRS